MRPPAGSASQGHSYVVQPSVAGQQEGGGYLVVFGLWKEEGGLADKNNTDQEERASETFETVQFVTKDGSGEEDSDNRTGKDDTESIRDGHEAYAGKTGDEGYGSYQAWNGLIMVIGSF